MSKKPTISVITPSYLQSEFIEQNLRSLLLQQYPRLEHVVVDGGSTDGTVEILKRYERRYQLHWISERDFGQSDALMKGFRISRGDLIGWLNSDDMYFERGTLSFVAKLFSAEPRVDVLYGDQVAVDAANRIFRVSRLFEWNYGMILRGNSLSQPATFFRRHVVLENELDKKLHHAMDLDFWLRLGRSYLFRHVQRILAAFRIHSSAKSTAFRKAARAEARQVLASNGQRWGIDYKVLRYLKDYPAAGLRKLLALQDCLRIPERIDELAFDPGALDVWNLTISQLWPLQAPFPLRLRKR